MKIRINVDPVLFSTGTASWRTLRHISLTDVHDQQKLSLANNTLAEALEIISCLVLWYEQQT